MVDLLQWYIKALYIGKFKKKSIVQFCFYPRLNWLQVIIGPGDGLVPSHYLYHVDLSDK